MNNFDKQNSIVLIGPKAVGKSLIASKLSSGNIANVISSDLLTNLIAISLSGGYETTLSGPLKEEYEYYSKIFNFKELSPYVLNLAKLKQDESLSEKPKKLAMQYWKIRLLEEAITKLKGPVILDLGADVGAVYSLSEEEKKELEKNLFLYEDFISSRQLDFLKQFKNIYFIKPSKEYFSSTNDRITNSDNVIYLQNPKSYTSFASKEISTDGLFSKEKYRLPERDIERLTLDERKQMINNIKLSDIVNEINENQNQQFPSL